MRNERLISLFHTVIKSCANISRLSSSLSLQYSGGLILKDATPELFKAHVKEAFEMVVKKPRSKQLIFVKSWNEWGEGNYMEPDLSYGKGYIEALKSVVDEYNS